jgi:hypothetical protein
MKFQLISVSNQKPTWYWMIDDLDEIFNHSKRYNQFLFRTSFDDPHFEADLKRGQEKCILTFADLRHPVKLGVERTFSLIKAYFNYGYVLINKVGGWMVLNKDCNILEEKEDKEWPKTDEKWSDYAPRITINKWPLGNHYYLTSWPKPVIFSQDKFNTYEEAFNEAKKFVPENRIKMKEPEKFTYPKMGD